MVQPPWRTVWRLLRKLKRELPYDPAIPLLGLYLDKTLIQKDTCIPMFTAALFTIAKTRKQPKCPEDVVYTETYIYTHTYTHTHTHTHNGILLSHKKNEIMPFAAICMQPEIIILSEVRNRKINTIRYHLYVESKI